MTDNATFGTIIIPYDGSQPAALAFPYAERIPSRAVRVVRVVPPFQVLAPGPLENFRPDWRAVRTEQAQQELAPLAERFRNQGRDVEIVVRFGDPAEEILAAAEGADLIVMTTQGRGTAGRTLFGSVADRVCRHADIPTLLVRAGAAQAAPQIAQIVVPLDGSSLAERALAPATTLAACLGLPVRLLRVVDPTENLDGIRLGREGLGAKVTTDDVDTWSGESGEAEAAAYLEDIAGQLHAHGLAVEAEVRVGPPAFVLLDELRADDVAVMTTHGRGGLKRWLLGSVAEKLVREAAASILLVRATSEERAA